MNYSKYISYSTITSPKTGHKCGRISIHNIKKFGFTSIEELHSVYPKFPTESQQYKDKKHKLSLERRTNKILKYLKNPSKCRNCNVSLNYEKKKNIFCSSSCSAEYNNTARGKRSDETKSKISKSVKNTLKIKSKENPDYSFSKKICNVQFKSCSVCSKTFCIHNHSSNTKKTCSSKCKNQSIRLSALSQQKHGGGKKGIYKGIRCDSSWELAYLIYNLDHGHNISRCNEHRKYIKNGEVRIYIPDFIVDEKIIEIKGYMSNTAKLKLLYNPDIIVIGKDQITKYITYVKNKYGCEKIENLYDTKEYVTKIKKCEYCDNPFDIKSQKQRFCSRACSGKFPKSDIHKMKISRSLKK